MFAVFKSGNNMNKSMSKSIKNKSKSMSKSGGTARLLGTNADATAALISSTSTLDDSGSLSTLALTGVRGEAGTTLRGVRATLRAGVSCADLKQDQDQDPEQEQGQEIPSGESEVRVSVNGMALQRNGRCIPNSSGDSSSGGRSEVALPPLKFTGPHFPHAAQIQLTSSGVQPDGNASFSGAATVPQAIFAQLAARQKAYPVAWDQEDQVKNI